MFKFKELYVYIYIWTKKNMYVHYVIIQQI